MPLYTKGKNAVIRFAVSLFTAIGAIAGAYFALEGPRLGLLFDFLASKQRQVPVAHEILIIETAGTDILMDPSTAASVIMTMAEMGADNILIQTPILGVSTSIDDREQELMELFDREFDNLGRNIENLFEGIRMGTVPPAETNHFVGAVLFLAKEGKQRLVNETVRRNNAGEIELEQAKAVFPNTCIADDHSVELARQNPASSRSNQRYPKAVLLYSHAALDSDGKLRRIVPLETDSFPDYEHIVFNTLKKRFGYTALEAAASGKSFLTMEKTLGVPSSGDRRFTLDQGGAIILRSLQKGQSFRRISLVDLIEYEKLDRAIYKILSEAADMGHYGNVSAENYPSYLWERERELRSGLAETTNGSTRLAWLDARNAYLQALDAFFYNNSVEDSLDANFSSLLQNEKLTDTGNEQIVAMRDTLQTAFRLGRDSYNRFTEIRAVLEHEVPGSFCILGAASVDTTASAALANAIITDGAIVPVSPRYIFLWSLGVAVLCVFIICTRSPLVTFVVGTVFSAAVLAGFSYSFIAMSVWLDPLLPLSGTVSGVLVSTLCALGMKRKQKAQFLIAYGPFVANAHLERLTRIGSPMPKDRLTAQTAVIAVKNPALNFLESGKPTKTSSEAIMKFRNEVRTIFLKADAVIAGVSGDTVLAAFGSPVERSVLRSMNNEAPYADDASPQGTRTPVEKAIVFLTELINTNPEVTTWHFGMDYGECTFTWTDITGYTAFGPPCYNARWLAANSFRYKAGIFVSKNCIGKIDGALTRKHTHTLKDNAPAEFYELLTGKC
jgi:hypothetical protein